MGEAVHLITLTDGATVVLSHGLDHFSAGRRRLEHETSNWESLPVCRPGVPLVVQAPGGGRPREYGVVQGIVLLEDSPQDSTA